MKLGLHLTVFGLRKPKWSHFFCKPVEGVWQQGALERSLQLAATTVFAWLFCCCFATVVVKQKVVSIN